MKFEVIVDVRENPKKCTIAPLSGRVDFDIKKYRSAEKPPALTSDFLLHIDGQCLSEFKRDVVDLSSVSLAAIDCHWRVCEKIVNNLPKPLPQLVKIPAGFLTAYPRKSKIHEDPEQGLATIEALFIAAAFLGHWDETLLDKYYWKEQFLALNNPLFTKYEVSPFR